MTNVIKVVAATLGLPGDTGAVEVLAEVDRLIAKRRDRLVAAAVADGRLIQKSAATWRAELDKRGVAAERELAALASVTRPAASAPRGVSTPDLMQRAFGIAPERKS